MWKNDKFITKGSFVYTKVWDDLFAVDEFGRGVNSFWRITHFVALLQTFVSQKKKFNWNQFS